MKKRPPRHEKALPAIALICAVTLPMLPAQDTPSGSPAVENTEAGIDAPLESLGILAESFVAAFNGRDAAGIAALFTPSGTIVGSDGDMLAGRQVIEDHYRDFFADERVPLIALEASEVQLLAPGIAVEEGVLHLTLADDEPIRSFSYTVTHLRQPDGSWLMASSRSLAEVTVPAERIKPLHWLIGEWTRESADGVRIDMVIDLDDRENFLLGEALITDAGQAAQSTNLRIGWNPATSSVFWWTFDGEGGNASGPWGRQVDDWIIHTTGITADAEVSSSSQTLIRDGDTMVWMATHRILAGEAGADVTFRFVRRAPDPISLLNPEAVDETEATDGE